MPTTTIHKPRIAELAQRGLRPKEICATLRLDSATVSIGMREAGFRRYYLSGDEQELIERRRATLPDIGARIIAKARIAASAKRAGYSEEALKKP